MCSATDELLHPDYPICGIPEVATHLEGWGWLRWHIPLPPQGKWCYQNWNWVVGFLKHNKNSELITALPHCAHSDFKAKAVSPKLDRYPGSKASLPNPTGNSLTLPLPEPYSASSCSINKDILPLLLLHDCREGLRKVHERYTQVKSASIWHTSFSLWPWARLKPFHTGSLAVIYQLRYVCVCGGAHLKR